MVGPERPERAFRAGSCLCLAFVREHVKLAGIVLVCVWGQLLGMGGTALLDQQRLWTLEPLFFVFYILIFIKGV